MNGGGGSSSSDDTVMRDVMEGYDSTSDDDFEIILGPPRPACVSCARCRRLFHCHAEFLNHIEACLARERMIKEQKGKVQCYYQFNAPHDDPRGGAGPSFAAPPMRALNLFNDPLELRLAPPGPPPPPPSLSLELTLAIGRNRPGGFRQQPGNNNNNNNNNSRGIGPGDGNVGKNFKK